MARNTRLKSLCFALVSLSVAAAPASQFVAQPARIERGKSATVVITDTACALSGVTVGTPATGVAVNPVGVSADGCKLAVDLQVASEANFGSVNLPLTKTPAGGGAAQLLDSVAIEITATLPEPIPPGLKPGVDVQWDILPYRETADAFGRKVASQYFAVNIRLGNNSAYPIQLAGFGFDLNNQLRSASTAQPPAPSPNSPYHVTRSTIERDREVGRRAVFLNSLTAALSIYSVAGGFFGTGKGGLDNPANALAKDRYGLFLAMGNPLASGLGIVFPDKTIRYLISIDTRAFRDNQVIQNNTHQQILTFISRDLVECRKNCADLVNPPGWVGTVKRISYNRTHYDSNAMKAALGNLVIIGQEIQYLNRVRVVSRADTPTPTPPVVATPRTIDLATGAADAEVDLTGNSLLGISATALSRPDVRVTVVSINAEGTSAKLRFTVEPTAAPGNFLLQIARPNDQPWTIPARILPAPPK